MTKLEREQTSTEARSLGRDAWERLCANRMARIGGGLFIGIALLCLIGPFCVPHSHETTQLAYGAQAPSWAHWFGTDELGRDILVRQNPFFGSLRKDSSGFGLILKASMVGFTLLSRSYYYLRRRSPGPPFPPDHRQAGERGAITFWIER